LDFYYFFAEYVMVTIPKKLITKNLLSLMIKSHLQFKLKESKLGKNKKSTEPKSLIFKTPLGFSSL
jgi:hypothetical protein